MKRKEFLTENPDPAGEGELGLDDIIAMVKQEVLKEAEKLIGQPNTPENRARLQESIGKAIKAVADNEDVKISDSVQQFLEAWRRSQESNPNPMPINDNPFRLPNDIYGPGRIFGPNTINDGIWRDNDSTGLGPTYRYTNTHSASDTFIGGFTADSISVSIDNAFNSISTTVNDESED